MADQGDELLYIYAVLRKLKQVSHAELRQKDGLDGSLFPSKFLLKIIDERLSDLDELSAELVAEIFKRFAKKTYATAGPENASPRNEARTKSSKCRELDEYFYYSLYYLYEFILDLDWHEPNIDELLSKADLNYVKSKLKYVNSFLLLKGTLSEADVSDRNSPISNQNVTKSSTGIKSEVSKTTEGGKVAKSVKSLIKSRLPGVRVDSPLRRRRVRFKDSPEDENKIQERSRERDYNQSVLALDLLTYALGLFIQHLSTNLTNWLSAASDLKHSLASISDSRTKIRTGQLTSILKQIKCSNDVFLTVLEHLHQIKETYLVDYMIDIMCARDNVALLNSNKIPRINLFANRVSLEMDKKVILGLANHCSQVVLNLVVSEINLPPVELNAGTKTKSREELAKSRENFFNFITAWFNTSDKVLGSAVQKNQSKQVTTAIETSNNLAKDGHKSTDKVSTLANAGPFKSTSRILNQINNLNEFMRDLLGDIVGRFHSNSQLEYFLGLIHLAFGQAFDTMSTQLMKQLTQVRKREPDEAITAPNADVTGVLNSLDALSVKIRCLKLMQITSCIDKLIREMAAERKLCINLGDNSLETRLDKFVYECTQQSGSDFRGVV